MNKVSQNRQKKENIVAELQKKVEKAKGMVFTNYQGLTHHQLEALKKSAKKLEAEFVATKNTLLKRALEQNQKSILRQSSGQEIKNQNDEKAEGQILNSQLLARRSFSEGGSTFNFQQPTATLFIYNDIVEPLKLLAKSIKELNLPKIKFGLLQGRVLTDQEVAKIATLPPLAVLHAQLLGQMKAPISGLHRALNWNLQQLVMTLSAIQSHKKS